MAGQQWLGGMGYCGLVCTVCSHAAGGCGGCRAGAGDTACAQRACCIAQKLDGCWECDRFPCDKGYFADPAWRGLCIGLVQEIRDNGLERFVDEIQTHWGERVDYGAYRFREAGDIRSLLGGDKGLYHPHPPDPRAD